MIKCALWRKKCLSILMVILSSVTCTGCGIDVATMRNVEERDYATVLLVDKNEEGFGYHVGIAKEKRRGEQGQKEDDIFFCASDLEQLKRQYELTRGKELSLCHLKTILYQHMDEDDFYTLVTDLDENREVAKTCPLLRLESEDSVLKEMEKWKTPYGMYLESMVMEYDKSGRTIPMIRDYLHFIREGEPMPVYEVTVKEEGLRFRCVKY